MQHFTPPSLQGPRNLQHLPVPVHARQQPALVQAPPRRLRRDEHPVARVAGKFLRGRVARFRLQVQVGPVHPADAPALGQLHRFRVGPPCPRQAHSRPPQASGAGVVCPSGPATCARPEATHRGYQSIHPASCRRRPILTGAGPAAFVRVPFGGWPRQPRGSRINRHNIQELRRAVRPQHPALRRKLTSVFRTAARKFRQPATAPLFVQGAGTLRLNQCFHDNTVASV
jgi:hypothetical protein